MMKTNDVTITLDRGKIRQLKNALADAVMARTIEGKSDLAKSLAQAYEIIDKAEKA